MSRELDAEVAERVMGIALTRAPLIPRSVSASSVFTDDGADAWRQAYPDSIAVSVLRYYSTDISAAMEVVEKLREQKWDIQMSSDDESLTWQVMLDARTVTDRLLLAEHKSDSLPEAICRAALKAVEAN